MRCVIAKGAAPAFHYNDNGLLGILGLVQNNKKKYFKCIYIYKSIMEQVATRRMQYKNKVLVIFNCIFNLFSFS